VWPLACALLTRLCRSDVAHAGVHVGAPCHERTHHGGGANRDLNPFFAEGPFELQIQARAPFA
jgi:hypothetical protein